MGAFRRVLHRVREHLQQLRDHAAASARYIWGRLTGEPGYAEALAALLVAAADLLSRSSRVRRVAHDLGRLLVAIVRTWLPKPDTGDGLWT